MEFMLVGMRGEENDKDQMMNKDMLGDVLYYILCYIYIYGQVGISSEDLLRK